MTIQKLAIASIVSTVFVFLLDYLWYAVLMANYFTPIADARMVDGQMQPDFMWLILGMLIFSVAFVTIYKKGAGSDSKVNEGMRYGIWVTLLMWVPMGFMWYSLITTAPLTEYLVDMVFRLVQMILLGIIVAHLVADGGSDRGKGASGGDG